MQWERDLAPVSASIMKKAKGAHVRKLRSGESNSEVERMSCTLAPMLAWAALLMMTSWPFASVSLSFFLRCGKPWPKNP
jgi:hypothetical protein